MRGVAHPTLQKAFGVTLLVLAGLCSRQPGFTLSNLFDEYEDSPDSTHLELGLPLLVFGVVCHATGILAVRRG
jgi:hypothetical protein